MCHLNQQLILHVSYAFKTLKHKVLRKIEEMKTRNLSPDMFRSQLDTSIKTNLTISSSDSKKVNVSESKKIDVASHFILRAAYCRTEDLRRWFLAQECRLFLSLIHI